MKKIGKFGSALLAVLCIMGMSICSFAETTFYVSQLQPDKGYEYDGSVMLYNDTEYTIKVRAASNTPPNVEIYIYSEEHPDASIAPGEEVQVRPAASYFTVTVNEVYNKPARKPSSEGNSSNVAPAPVKSPEQLAQERMEQAIAEYEAAEQQESRMDVANLASNDAIPASDGAALAGTTYNFSSFKTSKGIASGITQIAKSANAKMSAATALGNAAAPAPVAIYSVNPITFDKNIVAAIASSPVDIEYFFKFNGHLIKITIPKGTDLSAFLDADGFAGPLHIGKMLGTGQILN